MMLIPVTILTPFWLAIGLANLDLLMFSELFRSLIIYELCCREPLRRCPILVDRLPEIIASGLSFDHQLQIEACGRVQKMASYCLSKAGSRQRVDDDRWTSNGQLFPIFGCD